MIATTRPEMSVNEPTLYVAFELGKKDWKLAMTSGFGVDAVAADGAEWRSGAPWSARCAQGRRAVRPAGAAPVVSCYEAGRDGFWIHRALTRVGIANRVVDSASIEVNRRARRAKTDRLDALKLVRMLVRVCLRRAARVERSARADGGRRSGAAGESRADGADAGADAADQSDARLAGDVGGRAAGAAPRPAGGRRCAIGRARRCRPKCKRGSRARRRGWRWSRRRSRELDAQQQARSPRRPPASALRQLVQLKGVATTSASVLLDEGLVWRAFRNRRQIGGLLGFAPTPYDSGESTREQGISRAGNTRLQAISIQLAWNWVRWQPQSALTQWYRAHFGTGQTRAAHWDRRGGAQAGDRAVAVCRRPGVVPAGAILKVA